MKQKFVLIDHSIQNYGGHNLEYAIHVLRAAEKNNYQPVLVTNRELVVKRGALELKGIDVFPIYLFDFWGNAGKPKKKKHWLKRIGNWFRNWRTMRKIAYFYSEFGIFLSLQNRYEEYLRNTPYQARRAFFKIAVYFPFIYFLILLRGIKQSLSLLKGLLGRTFLRKLVNFIRDLFVSFGPVLRAVFSPLLFLNRHKKNILSRLRKSKRIRSFGKDTIRMIDKVNLTEGDIVFIPTLSEFDMLGLLYAFQKRTVAEKVSWHLLFRRNIFVGRDPQYSQQMNNLKLLRSKFLYFRNQAQNHQVFFYTDTDKLTYQYNYLKAVLFSTLPIPVNEELQINQRDIDSSTPIKITYIGDARREKGYQYIPEIARRLYMNYIKTNKVKFILQSNFSFTEYQHNSDVFMARHQLEQFAEGVELIKDSLSTTEYLELVRSSDIGLILYDRDNYYARSSGALVEYLSAGIPVIVPSGSWMSDQIADCSYQHHDQLKRDYGFVKMREKIDYVWSNYDDDERINIRFGGKDDKLECLVVLPDNIKYLLVSFELDSSMEGTYISIEFVEMNGQVEPLAQKKVTVGKSFNNKRVSAMFNLSETNSSIALLWFYNAFGNEKAVIKDVQLHYYDGINELPIASVGIVVDDAENAVEAIKEIVDHYPHYRQSAKDYSVNWNKKHNADALVKQLITRGKKE